MLSQKFRYLFFLLTLILLGLNQVVFGTFSIVAVDTVTREVGVVAASCVKGGGISDICHVEPDKGVLIAQALFSFANLNKGKNLLKQGNSAEAIIQELTSNDSELGSRQYGIVTFASENRASAFTGDDNPGWKGHIIGPNYSIQGNTLAGEHVCKKMETAFVETNAPLPEKLMAAIRAAKENGADKRCSTTSSLCACIKIAKPSDEQSELFIRIEVADVSGDPIDALQKEFDKVYDYTEVIDYKRTIPNELELVTNYPNPFNQSTRVQFRLNQSSPIKLQIFDLNGTKVTTLLDSFLGEGIHTINWNADEHPAGTYFIKFQTPESMAIKKCLYLK